MAAAVKNITSIMRAGAGTITGTSMSMGAIGTTTTITAAAAADITTIMAAGADTITESRMRRTAG